jgi:hypothetical protein
MGQQEYSRAIEDMKYNTTAKTASGYDVYSDRQQRIMLDHLAIMLAMRY